MRLLSTTTPANSVLATTFRLIPAQVQHLTNPERMVSTLQFTVPAGRTYVEDSTAPNAPTISSSNPASPANEN